MQELSKSVQFSLSIIQLSKLLKFGYPASRPSYSNDWCRRRLLISWFQFFSSRGFGFSFFATQLQLFENPLDVLSTTWCF
jgi:hypothetical protein